ncbi:MAG: hypothetical protein Q9163_004263, partial [Psora crenata]
LYHIIIVAGVYLVTLILAVFIYAGRLFGTRSALARIPRELVLGGDNGNDEHHTEGEVGLGMGRRMGKVVREGLDRSAIISYQGRPRDLRGEGDGGHLPVKRRRSRRTGKRRRRKGRRRKGEPEEVERSSSVDSNAEPVWGIISHPGWTSPESPDLPGLHFEPVIAELGSLIEAKAVSLAPVDPLWEAEENEKGSQDADEAPVLDAMAVEVLQRPLAMGLRSYISHLTTLGMIRPAHLGQDFLSLYERARFSGEELREEEFRMLMATFAEVLNNMRPLDATVLEELRAANEEEEAFGSESKSESESDDLNNADSQSATSNATTKHTPLPPDPYSSASSVTSRNEAHPATVHVAAVSPPHYASRSFSTISKASQSTSESVLRKARKASLSSLKKMGSNASVRARSSAGSVIRLAEARTPLDLPYVFVNSSEESVR